MPRVAQAKIDMKTTTNEVKKKGGSVSGAIYLEKACLMKLITEIKPIGKYGWDAVAERYRKETGSLEERDGSFFKTYFFEKMCNRMLKPTDLSSSKNESIRQAQDLYNKINERAAKSSNRRSVDEGVGKYKGDEVEDDNIEEDVENSNNDENLEDNVDDTTAKANEAELSELTSMIVFFERKNALERERLRREDERLRREDERLRREDERLRREDERLRREASEYHNRMHREIIEFHDRMHREIIEFDDRRYRDQWSFHQQQMTMMLMICVLAMRNS